ncbi:MAG: hypothetical protein IKQ31_03060 [Clostridia bacterium]|nr:hypothetical protein [Clostridia bacterium]MBR4314014.1 hypothetical protein [Lachnospiraceae bacterium]
MRNIKEIKPILTALYCINFINEKKDEDIDKIIKYAFARILDSNTNLLTLACAGRTKKDVMKEINQFLSEDTLYKGGE